MKKIISILICLFLLIELRIDVYALDSASVANSSTEESSILESEKGTLDDFSSLENSQSNDSEEYYESEGSDIDYFPIALLGASFLAFIAHIIVKKADKNQ